MSPNNYENIELYLFDEQKSHQSQLNSLGKDADVSTLTASKGKQLLKNKVSAQNSRLKKKRYIQELQETQRQLIQQIEIVQKQIQTAKQELDVFMTKNRENDSFNHDEKPTYDRLKKLIRQHEHFDEDEANMLIQLLINRVGVTGKERRRMVQYYTKRLVNFSIPAIYRYLLQASTQNKGLLSNSTQNLFGWDKQLYQKLSLRQPQKKKLGEMKGKIADGKATWKGDIHQFNQIRSGIYTISVGVQKQLLTLKDLIDTRQMGEIVVGVQNRKYNEQIFLKTDNLQRVPTKKVKKQLH